VPVSRHRKFDAARRQVGGGLIEVLLRGLNPGPKALHIGFEIRCRQQKWGHLMRLDEIESFRFTHTSDPDVEVEDAPRSIAAIAKPAVGENSQRRSGVVVQWTQADTSAAASPKRLKKRARMIY